MYNILGQWHSPLSDLYTKAIDQGPYLSFAWNWSYATSHYIYTTSHRFLIKLRYYSIDQLYLLKVQYYLIDCILFVYSFIHIWGGFQNNALKDILLLYIFCLDRSKKYLHGLFSIANTNIYVYRIRGDKKVKGGITELSRPGFSKNLSLSIKLGFKN